MYELQPKHSFTICCPLTDEGTDVVCPNCNFINDNLSIKPDGTVESKDYMFLPVMARRIMFLPVMARRIMFLPVMGRPVTLASVLTLLPMLQIKIIIYVSSDYMMYELLLYISFSHTKPMFLITVLSIYHLVNGDYSNLKSSFYKNYKPIYGKHKGITHLITKEKYSKIVNLLLKFNDLSPAKKRGEAARFNRKYKLVGNVETNCLRRNWNGEFQPVPTYENIFEIIHTNHIALGHAKDKRKIKVAINHQWCCVLMSALELILSCVQIALLVRVLFVLVSKLHYW